MARRTGSSEELPINIYRIITDSGVPNKREVLTRAREQGHLICAQSEQDLVTYDENYVVELNGEKRFVKPPGLQDYLADHPKAKVVPRIPAKAHVVELLQLPAMVSPDGDIVPNARQGQLVPA
jgi:hypothetical protein